MQMRVDGQGFLVTFNGRGNLIEMRVAMPHPGPRAEMTGHSHDGSATVGDAPVVIFREVIGDGPLVIRFGEIGIDSDGLTEYFDGTRKISGAERFGAAADELIGLGRFAAPEPDRPKGVLGQIVYDRIGIF